jgi:alpha-methylacyl-CoA racemase
VLDGVRVLDLTRLLPGAYATLMLADLGADVIKIEDPRGGDPTRRMPPLVDGTGVYFTVLNRSKRSVTLDLRSPAAADVVRALVAQADVVIDSFRPRTAARLGVDADTLRGTNPRLVCASITGFGKDGPDADRAAHDINYQSVAGLLSLDDVPRVPGLLVGDIGAAYQAALKVAAALFARERTGAAATVDVSIHDAALQWMVFPSAPRLVDGAAADPRRLPLRGEAARYNVYEASDGQWLALGALEEKFWVGFCNRVGRPDLAPMYDAAGDAQSRALDEVRALMRTRTRDEWLAHFADIDVCLTPVNSLDEALANPSWRAAAPFARTA